MPIINVQLITGRRPQQKAAFVKQFAEAAMQTLSVPETAVTIVLSEIHPDNWGVGTRAMTEVRATHSK